MRLNFVKINVKELAHMNGKKLPMMIQIIICYSFINKTL